ncbi:MAG: YciI family protein, partial [Acidimicrobiia bacterium]|nr:YciI family protein [Acidimicrobiia bacterium]
MKYVMLLHFPDSYMGSEWTREDIADHQKEYADYRDLLLEEGVFLAGEALQPADITTTVSIRSDDTIVTDGPFVESAEHIGGFYLCECRDLDHAIRIAAGIPGAKYGTVEVRPVFDYEALVR